MEKTEPSAPESVPEGASEGPKGAVLVLDGLQTHFTVRSRFFSPTLTVNAVDDVSLTIMKGETVAIVGESGCGKTTLGRTAIRLIEPTGGRILYDGQDITHTKMKDLMWLRRKTQIVPQDPYASVNPGFNVYGILEEPLLVHHFGTPAERAEKLRSALESVKLTPPDVFEGKFPHMLSGGQRQRVAVARAMILEPELIIADEPVSMLDASVRVSILELLRQIQEQHNVAFMYITHDLATARHFSNRIGVMYAGKLAELGPVRSVLLEPLHPYTQALMAAIPDPDPENRFRKIAALPGEPPNLISPPSGCRFHPRCPIAKPGVCDVEAPPLRELRPGHLVACHLAS
ncbi:MAG: oligopeptide ABC transporter ATP-binding protein [Euryarchaeota archaeon RBG_16_68_13]|nr:MAG: oligopeptide ABC transporter ATP-binding protein [Euryarchaeota archaeon RBG_16_68_13]